MAAVTGQGGTVSYGSGSVATIRSWSLDINTNMHDVSAFSTDAVVWREWAAGLQGWSGSIAGSFDPSSTGQNDLITNTITPTTAQIILEIDKINGGKFTGSCYLESLGASVDIDGMADMSWSVTGNGALTYTTST